MDTAPRTTSRQADRSRRRFLRHLAATSAAALSARALPVQARQAPAGAAAATQTPAAGIAETLADFAVNVRYKQIPKDVVRIALRTVLDTVGCAIGAYKAGPSQIAVTLAGRVTATPSATVICAGTKTSPELAAFANGVMIRYLDFNDGYITPIASGHPSDCLAALFSAAEITGASGRDLLLGTVLAYEVSCKMDDVFDLRGTGLDQSMILGLASLVGSARLMGLTRAQLVHAIGIMIGGNIALNQGRIGTLSNWKDFAAAEGSRKAIFVNQLAAAGMTGPVQIFEGAQGLFHAINRSPVALPPLGEPWGIRRVFTKRFPLGQYSQTIAEAAMQARAFAPDVDMVQEITLRVSRNAINIMADSPDKWRPQSHETADHSMPYATGVVLMYGEIDEHYYEPPYLRDERLLRLVSKVTVLHSDEADQHERDYNLCDMEVVLTSGQRKAFRVEYHRGHFKNPMTDAEMEDKFRTLVRTQLPAPRTDALLRQLWALETLPKAATIVGMTRV